MIHLRPISGILLFVLIFCTTILEAQKLDWYENVLFERDEELVPFATVGGLNAPQFSSVDLNNDGIDDLFVFDRTGNVELTFLNKGTADKVDYVFAPEYMDNFPQMIDFVLLRDYDRDGVMDIFTESTVPGIFGIEVFKGKYVNDEIAFDKLLFPQDPFSILYIPSLNGNRTQLYASNQDIPAIDDMDGDGDLDILSFEVGGGVINYYKNNSVEEGYGTDSLIYELDDVCWGKFFESGITNCLSLSNDPLMCASGVIGREIISTRHAGSTILTYDRDNDGDKEIILGDVSFPNLVMGVNGGTRTRSFITSSDCEFPSDDTPAFMPNFPSSFLVDVDNDNKRDLLVSPNSENAQDIENVWYYKNIGTEAIPDFELRQEDLLVGKMIDLGTGAVPRFVDYNADGLMDLVIGNEFVFQPVVNNKVVLQLYVNIGTQQEPLYTLQDPDWLGFSNLVGVGNQYLSPEFGDLDNDGDLDLLVGESTGRMFYAENTAGPGRQMVFGEVRYPYKDIRVGQYCFPHIMDYNKDGKPDLLIGERNGNVNLLLNTGTLMDAAFDSDLSASSNYEFFGRIDTRGNDDFGFSSPRSVSVDGEIEYFIGSTSGTVKRYKDLSDDPNSTFSLLSDDYGQLRIGSQVHADFANLDGDNFYEMVVGNSRGGISFFKTNINTGVVSVGGPNPNLSVELFPIPASQMVNIELPTSIQQSLQAKVFNALGQEMFSFQFRGPRQSFDVSKLAQGVYFLELSSGENRTVERFVKSNSK
ncbi:MAG: T9SS type A sorting domain-containing protein [Bacteroidota bacterium]